MNVADAQSLAEGVRKEIAKAVVGQADTIELMLIGLLAKGHVLLEGPPGTAKTLSLIHIPSPRDYAASRMPSSA